MNKSRILLALMLIVGAGGALATGTGAFFSDTETSTGNTFTAGAIDLLVDNESYATDGAGEFVFNGALSWGPSNLNNGETTLHKFFDFGDLKPGDRGEDTISLHVQNDAWACMDVTLTANAENGVNEAESDVDDELNGPWDGELAQNIQMFWWADDGDNVYESGEQTISGGVKTLFDLASTSGPFSVALADSQGSIWGGPIPANQPRYIGKAWCFGTLVEDPETQDNLGQTGDPNDPSTRTNGPLQRSMGFSCNGATLGNETQTDSALLDVAFRAIQARNNGDFRCVPEQTQCEFDNTVNLVANGDFELPGVVNPAQWDIFPSPVSGWQVAWRSDVPSTFETQNRPDIANLELHRGVLGSAFLGQQYSELDSDWGGPASSGTGEPASIVIYQDIATIPGVQYKVRFAFAPRPNTPAADNRLEVLFGGQLVHDTGTVAGGGGPIAWTPLEFTVTATTSTTRLQFSDLGTANSLGTFVDDVRLTQESCIQP